MGDETIYEKIEYFLKRLFCRHNWVIDEYEFYYVITCEKCLKSIEIRKGWVPDKEGE